MNTSKNINNHANNLRWSEPILRRRAAVMGDSDSSSPQRHSSEELLHSPTPIKGFTCMCHQQCQQNMIHSQNHYIKNVNQRLNRKKSLNESLSSDSLREQIQVQVCKKQLEEDLLSDRHDSQWRTLSRSGALLSSLAHYTQCVQMTSCAMNRVQEAAANLVHTDLNVSDKLQKMFKNPPKSQDVVKEFQELTKGLYSSLESSKELIKFLEEHTSKREDFAKASRNFSFYLSNTKITGNQLQRLKSQYNSIIDDYIKSRQIFEKEVPKMINIRREALSQYLNDLNQSLDHVIEINTYMAKLSLHLSEELKQEFPSDTCDVAMGN